MELASRIVSILLGAAATLFVLWPVTNPLGFGEVWWASRKAQSPSRRMPAAAPESKPATETPVASQASGSPHAVSPNPAAQKQVPPERAKTNAAQAVVPKESEVTGAVKAPAVAPQAAKLYRWVTVRDGGTLQAGKVVIRLAGISARGSDAVCTSAQGKTWPCGIAAKTALARLIRGRAVHCTLPKAGEHNIFEARCSVGGADLSTWMVRQGWAEPRDPALAKAGTAAKDERLGLWRASD
jgi:endonuclease YncB( thermonuclease family)